MKTFLILSGLICSIATVHGQLIEPIESSRAGQTNVPPSPPRTETVVVLDPATVTNSAVIAENIVKAAEAPPNPRTVVAPLLSIERGRIIAKGSEYVIEFASNARTAGAVELRRGQQPPLRSAATALAYAEGERLVVIAEVQPVAASILGSNQVLYSAAFNSGGVVADILYTCGARAYEQDVVVRNQLPHPSLFGLSEAAVFCVITEFFGVSEPVERREALNLSEWNQWLGANAGPLVDSTLGFGELGMRMIQGKAFSLQDRTVTVPVRKQWRALDNSERRFLIESTPYELLKPLQEKLSRPGAATTPLPKTGIPSPVDSTPQPFEVQVARSDGLGSEGLVIDYILAVSPLLNVDFTDENGSKSGPAAVGQAASDFWNRSITKWNGGTVTFTDLWWSDSTASPVDLAVQNAPAFWGNGIVADPMYHDFVASWNSQPVVVTLSQLPEDTYDLYVYGHSSADAYNGLFKLYRNGVEIGYRGTTIWGNGWASVNWTEGEQYVVFRDVSIAAGDTLQMRAMTVGDGYQYLSGLQLVPSASISEPLLQVEKLINIDACQGPSGAKAGPAAVGLSANDVWNLYHQAGSYGVVQDLLYSDGSSSGAALIVQNAPGYWGASTPRYDPMYDGWNYRNGGNVTVTLTDLPDGIYEFYLYAHDGGVSGNSRVSVSCDGVNYGTKGTTIWGNGFASANWQEGQQYVAFRDVLVVNQTPVQLTILPGGAAYALWNGLQIAQRPEDSDEDGLPDWWEMAHFGDLDEVAEDDSDSDGLNNEQEFTRGTDPSNPDTDGDGVLDGTEVQQGRDPLAAGTVSDSGNLVNLRVFTISD